MNNITQQYKAKSNTELQHLYKKHDVEAVLIEERIEWAKLVWKSNDIMIMVLNRKPNSVRPLRRLKTKMNK